MVDPLEEEEALFSAALARPVDERSAFLRGVAADRPTMAARVGRLLLSHAQPVALEPKTWLPPPPVPPGRLGRYTLGEKLGEGGVGIVYRAEQTEPFRREVALKVIKPGMDTAEVIARFESERQALALMDHPNIARVFDADATPEGRPYFVMELVRGPPMVRFCDEQRLSLEARFELFTKICHALHHAHGKGIIHRDIKSSNILVANHDGAFTPKVIDFGIAKAMALRLTERTLVTVFPRFMGTPSAMSPEQAAENGDEIDARSDVYSLGVLLCELVTGRTPLGSLGAGAGYETIRRAICEKPSPSLGELFRQLEPPARTLAAEFRHTTVEDLLRRTERELSWIARRCLAKDRNERYATARALADDIERYLRHEALEAKPPAPLAAIASRIRAHRFVRWIGSAATSGERTRTPASSDVRAHRAETRPINVEAHRLVLEGRRHWNEFTEEGFVRAEAAFAQALAIAPGYVLALAGLAYVAGRRAILATLSSRHVEPLISIAEKHARATVAGDFNVGEAHSVLGAVGLLRGRHAEAIGHLEQALDINANSDLAWAYLSRVHMGQGRPDLAIPELENARLLIPIPAGFALHRGFAFLLARRYRDAFATLDEAEQKGVASPNTRAQTAITLTALGRGEESLAQARAALAAAPKTAWTIGMNAYTDGLAAWSLAKNGARGEAEAVVRGILQLPERHHFAAGFATALLGDRARALSLLADTPEWIRDSILLFERETACFGSEANFAQLLRKLELTESWRSVQRVVDGKTAGA